MNLISQHDLQRAAVAAAAMRAEESALGVRSRLRYELFWAASIAFRRGREMLTGGCRVACFRCLAWGWVVPDRLLVDLSGEGWADVSLCPDDELPEDVSRGMLTWPLGAAALEDLRWYLEDYLLAPFGVWEERGPLVAEQLPEWGERVFGTVFGPGPARDHYQRARDRGLEVQIRSGHPGLLALPWELMRDGAGPVALHVGISRSLPVAGIAETLEVPGGNLRVLMVISRPAGASDVGYQMVARPLLKRLQAVRGEVELTVLRPPTFKALREAVKHAADAGAPFHVVHFDGHGVMPGRSAVSTAQGQAAVITEPGEGVLVFELPGGGGSPVEASKVAAVLAEGKVPVVVLNACQSGAMGKELEASVAAALLRAGCAAVVAMAYTVYAVAAAEFMAAFYDALFAGHSVGEAVTAGRRRLSVHEGRPSPKGDIPLADWLVPVHYQRAEVRFPGASTYRQAAALPLDEALDQIRVTQSEAAPEDPLAAIDDVFVGRDDQFYQLETAARLERVVVLTGPGGTGKTELAKGFARWWRDTGGVDDPRLVSWHSFEPGAASFGLDGVVNGIGIGMFGTDFARLKEPLRLDAVKRLLTQHRGLLVWDNFESVREMPGAAGVTPPLDEAGCAQLREFLNWVRDHSASTVIITSRTPEDWLGQVRRIAVGGLNRAEAAEYAGLLLAPFAFARARREQRSFGELLSWLDGHPLAMRLTLPRLEDGNPGALLASLRGTAALPADDDAVRGRLLSLGACITYSFSRLSEPTRRLLPALSLFHGIADGRILAAFSRVNKVPRRFRFSRNSSEKWTAVLEEATRVGLLSGIGAELYRIHPALPSYLAAAWQASNPGGYARERQASEKILRTAYGMVVWGLDRQIKSGDSALPYAVIGLQQRTLTAMLGDALDNHAWEDADGIFRVLQSYWETRGLSGEAAAWTGRILADTAGPSQQRFMSPISLNLPARSLWLYTIGVKARGQRQAGHLEQAERTYRELLAWLRDKRATKWTRGNIAVTYDHLGDIAQALERFDEAEDWYRKSLAIRQELGDRSAMGVSYYHLGALALDRDRLDEAERWCRQSFAIDEELGNHAFKASSYALSGDIARDRGRLDEAADWYRKSLTLNEEIGNRPFIAANFGRLGWIAMEEGRLNEAEDWYRRSLTLDEQFGNRMRLAGSYAQLGRLAEARAQALEALAWNIRCVTLFGDFPNPLAGGVPTALVRLTQQLGMPAVEAAWQQTAGLPLPPEVRDWIVSRYDKPGVTHD